MSAREPSISSPAPEHALRAIGRSRNPKVFLDLVGPAVRGFLLERGKQGPRTKVVTHNDANFVWDYPREQGEMTRLYEVAKRSQWNATTDLDWSIQVDPHDVAHELLPDSMLPLAAVPEYRALPLREQQQHRWALVAWILSQFLHGEQGALYAACQVTQAVEWIDGKLYGATQVVDEARHIEVFHRYLDEKLGKLYPINDNLYTIIDALMTDGRWDLKFLGMQIMIEGLALGAFGTMRAATREPLLRELLRQVITDEARHVTFGVIALRQHYATMPERERREREDWAYEITVLLRNRFLGHEFYDEYYAHLMPRRRWDQLVLGSEFMARFRKTMFRRLIPNLRRIHLLSDRVRPHYERLGLLVYERGAAAPELTAAQLLDDGIDPQLDRGMMAAMPSPSVVLFDVMGTLVHDPFFVEVPRFFGVDLRTLVATKHPSAWVEFELGEIDEERLAQRFFADGRTLDVGGLKRAMVDAYAFLPGIEGLLQRLQQRGVSMHVLSNYPCWYELIEDKLGLSRYLPWTFVSCHTGSRKPDARAYLGACEQLNVAPSACVFVDDRPQNCEGARAVGMDAIVFDDVARLESALHARGLLGA